MKSRNTNISMLCERLESNMGREGRMHSADSLETTYYMRGDQLGQC